jgi:hypothetical protein
VLERRTTLGPGLSLVVVQQTKEVLDLTTREVVQS